MQTNHLNYLKSNEILIKEAWECFKVVNPNLKDKDLINSCCNRYIHAKPLI